MNKSVTLDKVVTFEKTYAFSRAIEGEGTVRHIHYGDIHTKLPSVVEDAEILPTITETKDFQYLKAGDILVADASEDYKDLGKAICYTDNSSSVIAGLHTHCLRSNHDVVDPEYLINLFQTHRYRKFVWRMGTGVSVLGLSKNNLGKYEITLPDLDKQKKVALFYKKLNKKIQLQQRKIDVLQEQKKGYMQKIFNQEIRFKEFSGEWKQWKLDELAEVRTGKAFSSADFNDNGEYLVVTNKNIQDEANGITSVGDRIDIYDDVILNNYLLSGDNILVTMDGVNIGKTGKYSNEKAVLAQRVGRLNSEQIDFVYQITSSNKFVSEMNKLSVGNAIKHISLKHISDYSFSAPTSKREQEKIGSFFKKIDRKIQLLQQKIDLLQEQKKGFMQQMFI